MFLERFPQHVGLVSIVRSRDAPGVSRYLRFQWVDVLVARVQRSNILVGPENVHITPKSIKVQNDLTNPITTDTAHDISI